MEDIDKVEVNERGEENIDLRQTIKDLIKILITVMLIIHKKIILQGGALKHSINIHLLKKMLL